MVEFYKGYDKEYSYECTVHIVHFKEFFNLSIFLRCLNILLARCISYNTTCL